MADVELIFFIYIKTVTCHYTVVSTFYAFYEFILFLFIFCHKILICLLSIQQYNSVTRIKTVSGKYRDHMLFL